MNFHLQIILLIFSVSFFSFIIRMITNYKLELRYSLTWIACSFIFILFSISPNILLWISKILYIKEPVNALFLSVIFFLLIITFSLTIALSKKSNAIKDLVQEVGILKHTIEEITKEK